MLTHVATSLNSSTLIRELSRGTAVIFLIVYVCYLIFQLKSHTELFNTPSQKTPKRKSSQVKQGMSFRGVVQVGAGAAAISGGGVNHKQLV